jgi:hypothetical protein
VLASSTALAILASKTSALDEAFPEATTGCLRIVRFLSFFGLIVSVLGFVLSVPAPPSDLVAVESAICGMLDTVSVSTVIFWVEFSCLAFTCFEDMALDCLVTGAGGTEVGRLVSARLPLSLPLSCPGALGLDRDALVSWAALSVWFSAGSFSLMWSRRATSVRGVGELGRLTSCTVSSAPRVGVRAPDCAWESSVSLSDAVWKESAGWSDGTGRWIVGGASASLRRIDPTLALLVSGGGDRSRGETGHRGLSGAKDDLCDWYWASWETGCRVGVAVAERLRGGSVGPGILVLVCRDGLMSCWLFLRDLLSLSLVLEAVLRGWRAGEASREARGEWVVELLAVETLEDWPSGYAKVDASGGPGWRIAVVVAMAGCETPGAASVTGDDLSMTAGVGRESRGVDAENACQRVERCVRAVVDRGCCGMKWS